MTNLYLFFLAIFKASLITGVLPVVLLTLYLERRKKPKAEVIEFVSRKWKEVA